ncbi:PREDICTED: alkylglycerol monooxygenase isoform X2 [Nanorana parkeri]|uniref:alkylglycerol monooxygenase isoform X1 n=1 Tax=Nanorana parkeri TaxID=125878 RepID=UPI000854CE0D|nr:PREDICTED: alkylglycerol monooxygenase isoform X1 [Nanorana parkeri]XP_018413233.1 PREDICTED: alkylglycerol monooxygenase isoform X2 [Nanorana parkeri]
MGGYTGQTNLTVGQGVRMMFYVLYPNETSFKTVDEVPDYVDKATAYFIVMLILEMILSSVWKGRPLRINDGLTSLSAGVMSRLPDVAFRSMEVTTYIYIWNNYRKIELPWDSTWTWWLTFLGVDFCYYWFHRMAHEVNIIWAGHQTHHSSEHYNLTTALRQSFLQKYFSWMFYWPMALFIPPSVFAVHLQFNLLYQFWIHTELINNLGPLELVLNTPSHHRVHHGRNPYCIDSNYGGTLIIWDRMFGTFVAEKDKVVYGLTHPINTFEPFLVQLQHLIYIWKTFWSTPGFFDKLSVIFKGPGWGPGKPRLGLPEELPEVTGNEKPYSPKLSKALQIYSSIHFILLLAIYQHMFEAKQMLSAITILVRILYVLFMLTSLGFLLENRPSAAPLEMVRCFAFLVLQKYGFLTTDIPSLTSICEVIFSICVASWGLQAISQRMFRMKKEG